MKAEVVKEGPHRLGAVAVGRTECLWNSWGGRGRGSTTVGGGRGGRDRGFELRKWGALEKIKCEHNR